MLFRYFPQRRLRCSVGIKPTEVRVNIFSYIVNGDSDAARKELQRFPKDPDVTICISAITEAELRYGMAKRAVSAKHRQAIEGLLAHLEILPWGREEAAAYGDTRATLAARGHSVSEMNI